MKGIVMRWIEHGKAWAARIARECARWIPGRSGRGDQRMPATPPVRSPDLPFRHLEQLLHVDRWPQADRFAWLDWPRHVLDEDDDGYHVSFELPGFDPEDVELSLDHRRLILTGGCSDGGARLAFRKELWLPAAVDGERIRARHRQGLLTVDLAKAVARRRIPVARG